MTQLSIKRMANIAWWMFHLSMKKSMLRLVVGYTIMLLLIFLENTVSNGYDEDTSGYLECMLIVIACSFFVFIICPGCMFRNYARYKNSNQWLLMLPASNAEKYLMHYAFALLWVPLFFLSLVCADLLQYAVHILMGHKGAMLVMQYMLQDNQSELILGASVNTFEIIFAWTALCLWLHSLFALGATLFRSHKYSSLITSVIIIMGAMILILLFGSRLTCTWWNLHRLFNVLFLTLTLFNFLLSYRFFCRQQIAGRFTNL